MVEPTVLQNLPDHAMLLARPRPGRQVELVPVEFDPAIVTLPRVSMEPLADLPEPEQTDAFQVTGPDPAAELADPDRRELTAGLRPEFTLDGLDGLDARVGVDRLDATGNDPEFEPERRGRGEGPYDPGR